MTELDQETKSAIRYRDSLAALEIFKELANNMMQAVVTETTKITMYEKGFVGCIRVTASVLYDRFHFEYQITNWLPNDRKPKPSFTKREYLVSCGLTKTMLKKLDLPSDYTTE